MSVVVAFSLAEAKPATASRAVAGFASANENGQTDKVKMLDTDMDGQVFLSEYTASGKTQEDFAKEIDVNADGFVNAAEMEVGRNELYPGEKKDSRAKRRQPFRKATYPDKDK